VAEVKDPDVWGFFPIGGDGRDGDPACVLNAVRQRADYEIIVAATVATSGLVSSIERVGFFDNIGHTELYGAAEQCDSTTRTSDVCGHGRRDQEVPGGRHQD
jgi:hypothetical protein